LCRPPYVLRLEQLYMGMHVHTTDEVEAKGILENLIR